MEGSFTQLKQKAFLLNDLYIDPIGYQVKLGQREIDLTLKEFDLLYFLLLIEEKWSDVPNFFSLFQLKVWLMMIEQLMS